jgi:hypothetical protein
LDRGQTLDMNTFSIRKAQISCTVGCTDCCTSHPNPTKLSHEMGCFVKGWVYKFVTVIVSIGMHVFCSRNYLKCKFPLHKHYRKARRSYSAATLLVLALHAHTQTHTHHTRPSSTQLHHIGGLIHSSPLTIIIIIIYFFTPTIPTYILYTVMDVHTHHAHMPYTTHT